MEELSEIKIHDKKTDKCDPDKRCIREAPRATSSQNALTLKVSDLEDAPMCRICYNGPSRERLLKPCKCKGTIKYVHRNCLERWLESTSNQTCELCHHHYSTRRSRKSIWEWCRQQDTRRDRRNLLGDCACFLFLTPLGFATFWLCTEGAVYYQRVKSSTLETVALIFLAVFLVLAYVTWIALCTRYHILIWSRWRDRNWTVRIVDRSSSCDSSDASDDEETPRNSLSDRPVMLQPVPPMPRHPMEGYVQRPPTPFPGRRSSANPSVLLMDESRHKRNLNFNPYAIVDRPTEVSSDDEPTGNELSDHPVILQKVLPMPRQFMEEQGPVIAIPNRSANPSVLLMDESKRLRNPALNPYAIMDCPSDICSVSIDDDETAGNDSTDHTVILQPVPPMPRHLMEGYVTKQRPLTTSPNRSDNSAVLLMDGSKRQKNPTLSRYAIVDRTSDVFSISKDVDDTPAAILVPNVTRRPDVWSKIIV